MKCQDVLQTPKRKTIGLRVPDHPIALALWRRIRPTFNE